MQQWITVNAEGLLTSLQRAQIISRELYNITRPVFLQDESEAAYMLFSYITHPRLQTMRRCWWTLNTSYKYIRRAR